MLLLNYCVVRNFTTTAYRHAKVGRVINKMMGSGQKKRRAFSETPLLPNVKTFSKGSQEGRYSGQARRASVLNKLFMKYITDLLATEEHASTISGYGVEIHRVQIAPDYNALNVFWTSVRQGEAEVEKKLKGTAGYLRHELSSLKVIGNVPRINFVKDQHSSIVKEVEYRLSVADFGEDHVPLEGEKELNTELELLTPLPSNIQDQILKLDNDINVEADETTEIDESLPPMPQNVLELNHADILNRIKNKMNKSKGQHRSNYEPSFTSSIIENPIEFATAKERKEAFANFLHEREILRSKKQKIERRLFEEKLLQEINDSPVEGSYVYEDEEPDYLDDYIPDQKI